MGVGEGSQAVVVLLAGRVPQAEVDGLAVDHHVRREVVEDGGDVLAGKGVRRVGDEEAGLAHGAVAHNHALDRLHLCVCVCFLSQRLLLLAEREREVGI